MPRRKVHPENRQRVAEACDYCKASKKRCSATFPCSNCVRRGSADHCSLSKREPKSNTCSLPTRPNGESGVGTDQCIVTDSPVQGSSILSQIAASGDAESRPLETEHRTQTRMLWSRDRERVYVGNAATLSFLQLLRGTVSQSIGRSQFSHNAKNDVMLETDDSELTIPPYPEEELDFEQRLALIRKYMIVTTGSIHVVSYSEAVMMLEDPVTVSTSRAAMRIAARDVMLAIGAQCCRSEPAMVTAEKFFFARGQRVAFAGMLEDPSLELVRVFTLMSFYMLGACRRNTAFMYLGVAVQAAVAVGLHNEEAYSTAPEAEREKRLRIWMSLCVLDVTASAILGRTSAAPLRRSQVESQYISNSILQDEKTDIWLLASYRIAVIINDIVNTFYCEKVVSAEAADLLLGWLQEWSDSLPDIVKESSNPPTAHSQSHEQVIGRLHVACLYYFAVMLVTRPFLISVLTAHLAYLRQSLSSGIPSGFVQEDCAAAKLSTACVDSAVFTIQACLEIHQSDLLLGQMCLVKAFLFAAALILGFSMFARREKAPDVEAAFQGAREILEILAVQSAQAAHYVEIITHLSNAITEQCQRLDSAMNRDSSHYVRRVFNFNVRGTSSESRARRASPKAQGSSTGPTPGMGGADDIWMQMHQELDGALQGWDVQDLPEWDSFLTG